MTRTRVLVVDDSLTIRKRLVEVFAADPDFEVVGEAEDGKRATTLCEALRPDVVTLDMMLPVMTGLAATEYIMAYCPTPILIVSASVNRGELFQTYQALAAGAVDVLDKPLGNEFDGEWERRLRATVKMVSRIRVITHPRARLRGVSRTQFGQPATSEFPSAVRCVAIGASTGGPGALLEVFRGLPADFPLPIVFVLHIGRPFAAGLAEWLASQCSFRVTEPRDGELIPSPGSCRIFMAPPDRHLVIRGGRFRLTDEPERHSCRPSVDVLFESVASELGSAAAACLLTGMGRDGADGLLAVRRAGGRTIAQDEATSVVFGMPREAVLLGAAERVLPIQEVASAISAFALERTVSRSS